jgi:hypothetical protein
MQWMQWMAAVEQRRRDSACRTTKKKKEKKCSKSVKAVELSEHLKRLEASGKSLNSQPIKLYISFVSEEPSEHSRILKWDFCLLRKEMVQLHHPIT